MSRFRQIAAVTIIAAAGAVALIAQNASAATGGSPALKLSSLKVSGAKHAVLVTGSGRTVYLLTGDSMSHPTCTSSACLAYWPPATTTSEKPKLGAGAKGKLTVWKHGHFHQLVLNGHPLYLFAGDHGPGKGTGQGLKSDGGIWELLTSSGSGMKSASAGSSGAGTSPTTSATTTTDSSTTSSPAYSY
jgi:predicted lipoprotein with Yx(FWY)xxD motif